MTLQIHAVQASLARRAPQPRQAPRLAPIAEEPASLPAVDVIDRIPHVNTAARDDSQALNAIVINRPKQGVAMVAALRAALHQGTVTDSRRERKAPVRASTVDDILSRLKEHGIHPQPREKAVENGRTNGTITFYGTSALFYNHQEKTKIRMRVRFYVSYVRDPEGAIVDVQRAKKTASTGYLEIKVKTPRAGEENFVDKYRLVVPDPLLVQLINLDPEAESFDAELAALATEVKAHTDGHGKVVNGADIVDEMRNVIASMAKRNRSFLKPSLAISYERLGYAHDEKSYPLRTPVAAAPKKSLWHRQKAPSTVLTPTDVQYQMTIDQNVRAHFPLLPVAGETVMPVEAHFDEALGTAFAAYPQDVRVLELKEPMALSAIGRVNRSETHNHMVDIIVKSMVDDCQWGDFDEQVGKYGTFRRRIAQEHNPLKLNNEKIGLAFSLLPPLVPVSE